MGKGINTSGQVTGYFGTNSNRIAFLYDAAHGMVDLNSLIDPSSGWNLSEDDAINDRGQITGYGYHFGVGTAFLLTPVPEPGTVILAVLGVVAFCGQLTRCGIARRRPPTRTP